MNLDSNNSNHATSRAKVIDSLSQEYGQVTFYDSTTVIAGGKKHKVPEGTTHVSGQIRSNLAGSSAAIEQANMSNRYQFSPPGTQENAHRRREAIETLRREYGEVTFYDSTTVIAGDKKHQVPEGTVFISAPPEWQAGPRGGIYNESYRPRVGAHIATTIVKCQHGQANIYTQKTGAED